MSDETIAQELADAQAKLEAIQAEVVAQGNTGVVGPVELTIDDCKDLAKVLAQISTPEDKETHPSINKFIAKYQG